MHFVLHLESEITMKDKHATKEIYLNCAIPQLINKTIAVVSLSSLLSYVNHL